MNQATNDPQKLYKMMCYLFNNFVCEKKMDMTFSYQTNEFTRPFLSEINYNMDKWCYHKTTEKHLKNFMLSKIYRKINHDGNKDKINHWYFDDDMGSWCMPLNINGGRWLATWKVVDIHGNPWEDDRINFVLQKNARQKTEYDDDAKQPVCGNKWGDRRDLKV
jgi:hypothetical protein